MKTKCILLLMLASAIFLCATCEKETYVNEPYENEDRVIDYRSKWHGTYDCEKRATYFSFNVFVDILPVGDDSSVYIRERTIYDLNEHVEKDIKMKVKVNTEGLFSGIMQEPYPPYAKPNYVMGYFNSDSLFMKRYTAYDSMPSVPDDSVRGDIIRYTGVMMR